MEASHEQFRKPFEMPPELQRPTPRSIRRRQGAWAGCGLIFVRLFILPHMIIGMCLLLMVPITITEMFFGKVQQGRIVGKWITSVKRTNYHIRYAYDADGIHRTGERSCSRSQYDAIPDPARAQTPASIEIRSLTILGCHFHEALLAGESRWVKIAIFTLIALFWNGVMSVFIYMVWIAPWQEKRLYRWGTPVPGRITAKHTRSGKRISYYLD
jgi:hypothetical protein